MASVSGIGSEDQRPAPRSSRGPMATAMMIGQALIGLAGLALIALGLGFWAGHGLNLVPLHEQLGIFIVLLLWVVAGIGFAYGVNRVRLAIAIVWGFVVIGFGFSQIGILVGDLHWIVRVLHLLVGLAALGMAGNIAKQISTASMAKR